jgi:hypothetical protein
MRQNQTHESFPTTFSAKTVAYEKLFAYFCKLFHANYRE